MAGFDVFSPTLDLLKDHFIEASAGTGKTFAIEHLVERLIREKGIKSEEILVVTFTKAATYELKCRIRSQVENLQEERIFTIHSFCYHTLQEHAFDSKISLEPKEMEESREIQRQAVKDYFRNCDLSSQEIALLCKLYQGDFSLLVEEILRYAQTKIPIEIPEEKEMPSFDPELLREDLYALAPLYGKMCDRNKQIKMEVKEGFERFLRGDIYDTPLLLLRENNRLKRGEIPSLHYPALLPKLQEVLRLKTDPLLLFAKVVTKVRERLHEVVEERELLSFEDMISFMEKNVEDPLFCEKVRGQYKAVFVDEFQDTDPRQWAIFKKLFLGKVPLYLVGDPKQAIYRFRGADLYTYQEAKKEVGNLFYLDCNYRSTKTLVESLNAFFAKAHFSLPLTGERLEYVPIKAASEETGGGIYLLTASSEEELFRRVCEQADLRYKVAVLIKDKHQAERFIQSCPLPTHLYKGRAIKEEAHRMMNMLLTALKDPFDRNALRLVTEGPFHALSPQDFPLYRSQLAEEGIFPLLRKLLSQAGPSLVAQGGEELYEDLLLLAETIDSKEVTHVTSAAKEGAIHVMTVHASKGLEFDQVFPVGLALPPSQKRGLVYSFAKKCYTSEDPLHVKECAAEMVRQIYVACTRAKRELFLPCIEKISSPLSEFLEAAGKPFPSPPPRDLSWQKEKATLKKPSFPVLHFPSLPLHSFSSLARHESVKKEAITPLPQGPLVGRLLHQVLEKIDFANVQRKTIDALLTSTFLASHTEAVYEMCQRIAHTSLPAPSPFTLAEVDPAHMRKEWEFLYKSKEGYRKGFIDLLFEHRGAFYIIDYKSNVIVDSVEEEIARHQYDLQAAIYREAVEKFLRLFPGSRLEALYFIFLRQEDGIRSY